MNWPAPQDFNEAVQSPSLAFSDPDLKGGQTAVGATGLPLPRSGNFADVYQVKGADGRDWAVKCFTRPAVGMDRRYARIGEHLARCNLPVTVGFTYLAEGVRVRGAWYPALKMEWVEGLLLNQVVRDHAGRPPVLEALFQMWAKLSKRLREAGVAHADIQHGNVLLVPGARAGSFGLKLIDYDGMYTPALANHPAGELGHANFQHPDRASGRIYSQDLDRFPHLVVATALRGLAILGPTLWERYDTGENLLFVEADFQNPTGSRLMRELWHAGDPGLMALVSRLAASCKRPIPQTPWLDAIVAEGVVKPLSAEEGAEAAAAFGVGSPDPIPLPVPNAGTQANEGHAGTRPVMGTRLGPVPTEFDDLRDEPQSLTDAVEVTPRRFAAKGSSPLPYLAGAGALVLVAAVGLFFAFSGGKKKTEGAQDTAKADEGEAGKPGKKDAAAPVDGSNPPPAEPPDTDPDTAPATDGKASASALPGLPVRWTAPLERKGRVTGMAFSKDGSRVAVCQQGSSEIAVLDARTGKAAGEFTKHTHTVLGVHALSDGKFISLAFGEEVAMVWDPETLSAARLPIDKGFNSTTNALFQVSPDARYVVTGQVGKTDASGKLEPSTLSVLDTTTGKVVASPSFTRGIARFSPDGTRLFLAEDGGRFRTIAIGPTGAKETEALAAKGTVTRVMGLSPDGTRVVSCAKKDKDGIDELAVHDAATGAWLAGLGGRPDRPGIGLEFSPDGKWLFAVEREAGRRDYVVLFDAATWKATASGPLPRSGVPGSDLNVRAAYFAPDGKALVAVRSPTSLLAFNLPGDGVALLPPSKATGTPATNPTPTPPPSSSETVKGELWAKRPGLPGGQVPAKLVFSGDGKTVFAYLHTAIDEFYPFDAATGRALPPVRPPSLEPVLFVQPCGTGLLYASVDRLRFVPGTADPNREVRDVGEKLPAPVTGLSVQADGRFALAQVNGTAHVVGLTVSSPGNSMGVPRAISWHAVGPLEAGGVGHALVQFPDKVATFKLPELQVVAEFVPPDRAAPTVRAVSPDGRRVWIATGSPPVHRVIDPMTGKQVYEYLSDRNPSFMAENGALVIPGRDGFLLDPATGRPRERADLPEGAFQLAALAPQGRIVAGAGRDGALRASRLPGSDGGIAAAPAVPVATPEPPAGSAKPRWTVPVAERTSGQPAFSLDGRTVYVTCNKANVFAFDAATGKALGTLPGKPGVAARMTIQPLPGGTLAVSSALPTAEPVIWDPRASSTTPAAIPPIPAAEGRPSSSRFIRFSPDGRYVIAARMSVVEPDPTDGTKRNFLPAPFRVFGLGTGQAVVSTDWKSGFALFTPDGSRVLVAGEAAPWRWFKMPSGEPDGTLRLPVQPNSKVTWHGLSNLGKVMLFSSAPAGGGQTVLTAVDTATGAEVRRFPGALQGTLSDDGQFVAHPTYAFGGAPDSPIAVDVVELATGKRVLRATIPKESNEPKPALAFNADGRALAVYRAKGDLSVYDLPGGGVAVGPTPTPSPTPVPVAGRLPVPAEEALAKATVNVQSILAKEYALKAPTQRKALALKLLKLAAETTDDAAARYVMFRDARDFAIEAGDPALALQSAEELAKLYDLDPAAERSQLLEKFLATSSVPATLKGVTEQALEAADKAWDAEEYDAALKMAQLAAAAAKKGAYAAGTDNAEFRLGMIRKLVEAHAAVKPSLDALNAAPGDPAANLAVGKYRCFVQGRWDLGIKNLAAGSDAALKQAAANELEVPAAGAVDVKVAEGWWSYAQTATDDKKPAEYRARYWYQKSLNGLSGLAKLTAESRAGLTAGGVEYRPGLVLDYKNTPAVVLKGKKSQIDLSIDFNGTDLKDAFGRSAVLTVRWTGAIVPPQAGQYRLVLGKADPVRVRVNQQTVLDTNNKTAATTATVRLPEGPSAVSVEYTTNTANPKPLQLQWVPAGSLRAVPVPSEALYHDKKAEAVLGK